MKQLFNRLRDFGFITPKFIREAIADQSGRKAHDIMVRVWSAAIFYLILGIGIGIALPW